MRRLLVELPLHPGVCADLSEGRPLCGIMFEHRLDEVLVVGGKMLDFHISPNYVELLMEKVRAVANIVLAGYLERILTYGE